MVKSDVEYLGGDATILEGKDNNPNYPTDENHYLIAIRVHKTYDDYDYDYHFMIKKNGEWCFKDGLSGEILKIKDYKTPSNVYWNARYYDLGDGFNATDKDFYRGDIQYMVISKLPVSITLR